MLFRIAKGNQERAGKAFTVEREKNNFGYKKSGILKPKSNRIMHYYEVDMIDADRIICTVRHKNNDCIVALVWLSGYTPDSIEVDQAELYRNCSNYPYRREYNEKYLKKYDQIACIVHGAIAAGVLFDTVEAPTTEETSEAAQDTTCTDKEPQEGTETVQKTTDMATFCAAYRAAYTALYDNCGEPETDKKERYYCTLFDQEAEAIADIIRRFCVYRGDLLTSDREAAAFMIALETVGAPTDGETATDGETTTTTETKPQRAAERPQADAEPHHPANDQEPQEAAKKTTSGQTNTRTDKTPQEATQRPKRGTHSPATYEAHKTATAPAGDQGTTAGDKDNTRSDKAPKRGTQPPQETATAPQPATVSEAQEPANDQEPKTAADCHRRNLPQGAQNAPQRPKAQQPEKHPHKKKQRPRTPPATPGPLPGRISPHPATLARMPQDARNEHRPNEYTPHTPKARHGPHRRPATGAPSEGTQPQKQVLGQNVKFRKIYWGNFDPPQFSSGIFPVFKTLFVRPISRYPLGRSKCFTDRGEKISKKFYEGGL